jgi:ribosome biogenesis protein UTP30
MVADPTTVTDLSKVINKSINESESKVDGELIEKAVKALLKHHEKSHADKNNLLGHETIVQLQLGLNDAPQRSHVKPIRLLIPHPFRKTSKDEDLEEPEVCLIVKDEAKPWVQEMITNFPEHMSCIKKVLTLDSLRKKHAQYQQRRSLLARFNLFMADDRILPMLTSALGKDFFVAKKQPIPVRLTRKEALPFTIKNALQSTFFSFSRGTCVTIIVGKTDMEATKLRANILSCVSQAVAKIPKQWNNLLSLSIKTPDSVSLPFYNKTPEILAELSGSVLRSKSETDKDKLLQKESEAEAKKAQEEKKKKRKLASKSPLVRSVKKLAQEAKEGKIEENAVSPVKKQKMNDGKPSKKEGEASKATPMQGETHSETSGRQPQGIEKDATQKQSIKKQSKGSAKVKQPETDQMEVETPKTSATEKDKETNSTKKKEKGKTAKPHDERATEESADKINTNDTKFSKKNSDKTHNEDFIAAKKFIGSKKGYVFKSAARGLGYYKDIKPIVDKSAIAAFARLADKKGRGSSGGGSKQRSNSKRRSR